MGPDSTYNCLLCSQKVVANSIQGYLLPYLHCIWIKGSFVGTVSEGGSFLSRSPQQMSLHDSLLETELLDLTALCWGGTFCWLFLANYCGPWKRVSAIPNTWVKYDNSDGWKERSRAIDEGKLGNDTGGSADNWPQWLCFSFYSSKWSPLPLILLTDLLG